MKSIILLSGAALTVAVMSDAQAPKKPNFIIILADDMGYGDAGFTGNTFINTPNIDRLAKEGMTFNDFHSNGAVSSPTRCALVTGRYQQRAGLENVILASGDVNKIEAGLQPQEVTFAKVLSDNGYRTALLGKWHLGYKEKYNPLHYGFQKYVGFKSGNVDYQSHRNRNGDPDWWDGFELKDMPGYTTTLLTTLTTNYIKENKNVPFCVYMAHGAPHSPLQGPTDPAVRDGVNNSKDKANRPSKEIYKDMIEELDRSVGEVVKTLKECGIEKNTLVIFFSDNGPVIANGGSAGSFRGAKGQIWEGGHHEPGIMYMPGSIKAGAVCNQTALGMDIFPTLIDMAGVKYDDRKRPLDGVSLVPALKGGAIAPRTVFWGTGNNNYAVREGNWKLVKTDSKYQLYDLEKDPSEQTDVAGDFAGVVCDLKQKLDKWHKSVYSEVPNQIRAGGKE